MGLTCTLPRPIVLTFKRRCLKGIGKYNSQVSSICRACTSGWICWMAKSSSSVIARIQKEMQKVFFWCPPVHKLMRKAKDWIFILKKDFTVFFFPFLRKFSCYMWYRHWTTPETESWSSCFESYVYSIYFRTIKIQICDKGLKVKNVPWMWVWCLFLKPNL